ncbi:hypothetical protein FJT64_005282 [Amphibalanus amphitrite]|uniref:Uncharacterized protein n=1 Tax=Amphibalanus amphitrite TaxID=1232801 RepID=A0A6A4VUE8_AMPAM|nr:hypothetical protein FJT64_005282 [Amphibalanus amphitrite]
MLATAAAFATALGAASAMELDTTGLEDIVDPRILLIVNGSNFNTTNLQFVLAGVALATLAGLLMALCLYALSYFFSGNDDSYGYGYGYDRYDTEPDTYAAYSQGSQAFQARALGGVSAEK